MAMMLVAADQSLVVEQLMDVDPNWKGIKVETSADQTMPFPTGSQVKLAGGPGAGEYKVSYILSPASPRGWRIYLEPFEAAEEQMFVVKAAGLLGPKVRRSVVEYTVTYNQLSPTLQRLNQSGAKILSITPTNAVPSRR